MEYADEIIKLQTVKENPSNEELLILDNVFVKNKNTLSNIFVEFKESLIIFILYIILSIDKIDGVLKKNIPILEKSNIYLIVFKGIILVFVFWIIKNICLARSN